MQLLYGNPHPDAELVILYGNCQVPFIARLLAIADGGRTGRGYLCVLNHAPVGQAIAPVPAGALPRCRLYLEQHDKDLFIRVREELREGLPHACPMFVFPTFLATFLWPFRVAEPDLLADSRHPFGRYPEGDSVALEIAAAGLRGQAALDAYMALSEARMPDLDALFEIDARHIERRDSACDVRIGDQVLETFREQHLFWNFGHVSAQGIGELARRIYEGAAPELLGDALGLARLQRTAAILPGMGPIQQPIHPRVVEHFGLRFGGAGDMRYRWFGQAWTFAEYVQHYIAHDQDW